MGDRGVDAIPCVWQEVFRRRLVALAGGGARLIRVSCEKQRGAIDVETMREALEAFCARHDTRGWSSLPFFRGEAGSKVAARVDAAIARGCVVLPPLPQVFNALVETPLEQVRVVILGQDPYPTPGDAHGLAFSYVGRGRLPASLRNILREVNGDTGADFSRKGDLTAWARSGVLLLNTALTTKAAQAGAHLRYGWDQLTNEILAHISRERPAVVFMFWGAAACAKARYVDRDKHLVLCSGHPSPLNRKQDFLGCGHFIEANKWLVARGQPPVEW